MRHFITKKALAEILVNDVTWDGEKDSKKLVKMYTWEQLNDMVDILLLNS